MTTTEIKKPDATDSSEFAGSVANDKFLKNVIKLNNWFIVHQLSAYRKADQKTRDHLDGLYAEFNRRWKLLLQENKLEDLPPQND